MSPPPCLGSVAVVRGMPTDHQALTVGTREGAEYGEYGVSNLSHSILANLVQKHKFISMSQRLKQ